MKISKLFHWLYASLMFLPLLVAPIFAIYSHRHTIDTYSIQVQETKSVDFNQLVKNGNFADGTDYWTTDNASLIVSNETAFCLANAYRGSLVTSEKYLPVAANQKVIVKTYLKTSANAGDISLYFYGGYGYADNIQSNDYQWLDKYVTTSTSWGVDLTLNNNIRIEDRRSNGFDDVEVKYVMAFNLTKMFGAGNEPSLQEFNTWYDEDYYPYTLSHRELLKTGNYITYDDTDIGSQFLYDLYNTTDKYLNFDSVLNLYQVNDWINLNVFNGSVPLVWYIIWHYLDYWLLLSIFRLCFDVLIYVPQLAHRWLDKASLE